MNVTVKYLPQRSAVSTFRVTQGRRTDLTLFVPLGMQPGAILRGAMGELSDVEVLEVAAALGVRPDGAA